MQIRMLVDMPEGATRNGQPWPPKGKPADLPTAEAAHLVASGVAEEVVEEVVEPPAEVRKGRRRAPDGEGE